MPTPRTLAPPPDSVGSPPAAGRHRVPWFMRITLLLQSAAILAQAVTAGLLLASVPIGRTLHAGMAQAVLGAVLLNLLAAVLAWRPGGGSPRLILKSTPMLVFTALQAVLGAAHVREVHVPLGVLMFGASVMLLMQARGGETA
ncbi:hypothetical protein SBI_07923 [Streptomyces bingchenggensis BCW-1]|uniref:Integral membrane protein n=2 Tax=Streptomyces TaxID=1883 RepID=D7CF21_STRBB|nr:hypothetical protein SBI_07923 [Streptomyces bingchenggensis BCW-1]